MSRLRAKNEEVITVQKGDAYVRLGDHAYALAPEDGQIGYDALVADLSDRGKLPNRVVHLWTVTSGESVRPGSSWLHHNLESGFYSLFFLARALTGTETYSLILGGTVLQQHLIGGAVGEDETYEAIGYTAWDSANNCYSAISVDNMGMAGKVQLRKLDDRLLVATMAIQMYGQPTLTRTTLNLNAEGHISTVFSDMISGASEVQRTFSGTYTRR